AVYRENISLRKREKYEGLTLEAPQHATLEFPPESKVGVVILDVPRVTMRGFHVHAKVADTKCIGVGGLSPGTVLEDLTCSSDQLTQNIGVLLDRLSLRPDDEPVRIVHCNFANLGFGVELLGMHVATKAAAPIRRLVVADNRFEECLIGMWAVGQLN